MSVRPEALEQSSPAIDRISPTLRPRRRAVMRMNWRDLLFLHWPMPAVALRRPDPTATGAGPVRRDGVCRSGPVHDDGRPSGRLPSVPGLSSFHETNVRTYVRLGDRDPGVWFFSLDAANRIAVKLARSLFHLPYRYARMFLEHEPRSRLNAPATILYAGVRHWPGPLPASYAIRALPTGTVQPAQPGTLEHFLAERYFLYSLRKNQLYQGQVHHYSLSSPAGRPSLARRKPFGCRRARSTRRHSDCSLRRRCRRRGLRTPTRLIDPALISHLEPQILYGNRGQIPVGLAPGVSVSG